MVEIGQNRLLRLKEYGNDVKSADEDRDLTETLRDLILAAFLRNG